MGAGGISSRAEDSDPKAKKIPLAPETRCCTPALSSARTALTRTPPSPPLAHAHCSQPPSSPGSRGPGPSEVRSPRGRRPSPVSARRGGRSSRARGRGTRRAAAGTSGAAGSAPTAGGSAGGPKADRVRGGVTPPHRSPRRPPGRCRHLPLSRRWAVRFGKARGAGWVRAGGARARAARGAQAAPHDPGRRAGSSGASLQGAPTGWRPAGTCGRPGGEEGPAGARTPVGCLRASQKGQAESRGRCAAMWGRWSHLSPSRDRGASLSGLGRCERPQLPPGCWLHLCSGVGDRSPAFLSSQRSGQFPTTGGGRQVKFASCRGLLPGSARSLTCELRASRPRHSSPNARPSLAQGPEAAHDPAPRMRPDAGWGLGRPGTLSPPRRAPSPCPLGGLCAAIHGDLPTLQPYGRRKMGATFPEKQGSLPTGA